MRIYSLTRTVWDGAQASTTPCINIVANLFAYENSMGANIVADLSALRE
ncbi:hypothetical protein BTTAP_50089 [Brochothrix thermosphacta]|uniref:Uncharacterized protein n=1 Tax=Brochothrix thermosphacta TaxID=2756 RepID=A0A2X0QDI7_BROTH|nr:hypothetical protein BTEBP_120047 [Brochothrix thermosphacta]SPP26749.1 hypothetical protein BTBSAS_110098 [Brochothrix thermosphacta]SPP29914.1 hypothetical protein BTTAP_50089 [Brochothrix thermosphacta]